MDFWNIKKILIVCIVLATGFVLAAEPTQSADKIEKIMAYYETIDNYRAEFQQTNFWLELDKSFTSSGVIYLKKEKILLKYNEPEGQLLLVDEYKLLMYDPMRKQAVYSDPQGFDINPRSLLEAHRSQSEIILEAGDKTVIEAILDNGETYNFIVNGLLIERIVYTGINGDYVQYDLIKPEINSVIKDEIFEINLPRDITIIDNRSDNFENRR